MKKLYVIFTVDWEKDHGKWRYDSKDVDYGGILIGTKCLEDILDDLSIPCVWLIETHKDYPELDIPKQFPEYIFELKNRRNDEIGTHIHWGSYNHQKKSWEYPTHDTKWINGLIRYAKEEMTDFKINPVSFRGGAFFDVPNLPKLLQSSGYLIDSTYFHWKIPTSFINRPRLMSKPPSPYFSDLVDFRKCGQSDIVEFPVYLNIITGVLMRSNVLTKLVLQRFKYTMPGFVTIFLHIDEITDYTTGPNEMTKIDKNIVNKLKYFLEELTSTDNVKFVTFSEALKVFKKNGKKCEIRENVVGKK